MPHVPMCTITTIAICMQIVHFWEHGVSGDLGSDYWLQRSSYLKENVAWSFAIHCTGCTEQGYMNFEFETSTNVFLLGIHSFYAFCIFQFG